MEVRPSNINGPAQPSAHVEANAPVAVAVQTPQLDPAVPTYSNSVVRVMAQSGLAVMVVRDGMDGEPRFQYPAEKAVREYESHAAPPVEEPKAVQVAEDDKPPVEGSKPEPKAQEPASPGHVELNA